MHEVEIERAVINKSLVTYILEIRGGAVELQVTHSQLVGMQGSPPSPVRSLRADIARRTLRLATFVVKNRLVSYLR